MNRVYLQLTTEEQEALYKIRPKHKNMTNKIISIAPSRVRIQTSNPPNKKQLTLHSAERHRATEAYKLGQQKAEKYLGVPENLFEFRKQPLTGIVAHLSFGEPSDAKLNPQMFIDAVKACSTDHKNKQPIADEKRERVNTVFTKLLEACDELTIKEAEELLKSIEGYVSSAGLMGVLSNESVEQFNEIRAQQMKRPTFQRFEDGFNRALKEALHQPENAPMPTAKFQELCKNLQTIVLGETLTSEQLEYLLDILPSLKALGNFSEEAKAFAKGIKLEINKKRSKGKKET